MDWSLFDFVGIDPYATRHPDTYSLQRILTVRNSGSGNGSALSMMDWLKRFDLPIVIAEWGFYRKQPAGHTNSQPPVDPIPFQAVADWITEAYAWMKVWNQANPPRVAAGEVRGPFIDTAMWFNYTLNGADCPLTGPIYASYTTGVKVAAYDAVVADSKQ